MATVKNNIVTEGLSGKLGDRIVFRQRAGKTIVAVKPVFTAERSEAQKRHALRFKEASQYASRTIQDANMKAAYEAKALEGQNAYNMALADYLHAPDISEIDASLYDGKKGSHLRIRVSDDYMVSSVKVMIYGPDQSLLEEGNAVQAENAAEWIYTIQKASTEIQGNRLLVRAFDLPGNLAERAEVMS
jgi:hypothetical protein